MFTFLASRRKALTQVAAVVAAFALAACDPMPASQGPSLERGAPVQVALILPGGSGNPGDDLLARNLKQAADMAIADLQGVKIDLRVYNAGADPAASAAIARRAVDEGAKVILGPVFAESANAAGVAVAGTGVNVLSFSNNTDIAGGNVFVLGPTFQNTADRLVSYAARSGKGRIMIVYDQNTAGEHGRQAIVNAAQRSSGASIAGAVSYEFSQQGVIDAVPVIASQVKSMGANSVFFTADTAGALPLVTQLLPESGVNSRNAQFVGLTRWDIPSATLSIPGVQGGWFAMPDPGLTNQFRARFNSIYGEDPHPIAGLAYDGIAAIGALAKRSNGGFSAAALTQGSGFAGVNGVFRLLPDGTNQRGLAVAQIQNAQVVVIDPAPRKFGGAGF